MAKQTSERVDPEIEKTSRRLTAQIHANKKEIARLNEVSNSTNYNSYENWAPLITKHPLPNYGQ
jgi:hypothetical protein